MSDYDEFLNIVGFAPHDWAKNKVGWFQLHEWLENFTEAWSKEKKLRRRLMKLALSHPSWSVELYHYGEPIYIQVRATSQVVEDEDEAARISRCHNKMYPLDFCCYLEAQNYKVATYDSKVPPLRVEWQVEEVEKSKLEVLEDTNN